MSTTASSAVSSAVTTIGNLLTQEAIYLWGVEEQVDRLETELKWMQSFLMEADSKQHRDGTIRLWVAEIRELAYDAEDVVEDFALKIGYKNKGGLSDCIIRSACILKHGQTLHETRSKIEKIIEGIDDLVRKLLAYGIKELRDGDQGIMERRESRRAYPHIMDHNIVGLDDDIEELVSVLVDGESKCKVVSICGMGGLGKTTLAKKIYHHSRITANFKKLAWVYVSQQCQKRKVWEDILSRLMSPNKDMQNMNDELLAETLFKVLKDEKCLVVLDDIWSIEAWDSLKHAFPVETDSKSKILLTSRNSQVVSHADENGRLYPLQCLNEEESWELFQKIAFPPSNSTESIDDEEMKKLGKEMVKSCAGLPLAIIVLGGILATKRNSLIEWRKVSTNVNSYLKSDKGQGPQDVLALSYDDLPHYLRPCFLYLSHFPEDYEIHADRLIQLWVAEGIVSSNRDERDGGGVVPEDVGEDYLMELVERCMIQVRERDVATSKVKTFQMHDLMRDLCLSKAKQENFLFIVDQSNAASLSIIRKVRRVSAHEFFRTQCIKSPNLRSLLFFTDCIAEENELRKAQGAWTYIFNNLKFLRVLKFQESSAKEVCMLPNSIGNLIHLRFLSLRGLNFLSTKLPSSLGNLRCLQTLDLRCKTMVFRFYCLAGFHVPDVIWRMEQLRHLYLPSNCTSKTKLRLDTLRNLLTLVNFNTRSCHPKDLINMTNIRELKIGGPFNIEDFNEENPPIIRSRYLHSLSIIASTEESIDARHLAHLLSSCISICKLGLKMKMIKLPEFRYLPSSIAYIHLKWCELDEDPMPTLEKLPNLRILQLLDQAFVGEKMLCSAQGFPKLESLTIKHLYKLKEWKVDDEAMPALHHLEIIDCSNLNLRSVRSRFNKIQRLIIT